MFPHIRKLPVVPDTLFKKIDKMLNRLQVILLNEIKKNYGFLRISRN